MLGHPNPRLRVYWGGAWPNVWFCKGSTSDCDDRYSGASVGARCSRHHVERCCFALAEGLAGGPLDSLGGIGGRPGNASRCAGAVVYLSTTGVYGNAHLVDENTNVDWMNERARVRLLEEQPVTAGRWTSLILSPAAIYGPGRGAHKLVRRGKCVAGENFVSRIHVDDLATHVEAGLLSDVCGAYPVAGEEPSTTREMAEFCARLVGISVESATARAEGAEGGRDARHDGESARVGDHADLSVVSRGNSGGSPRIAEMNAPAGLMPGIPAQGLPYYGL